MKKKTSTIKRKAAAVTIACIMSFTYVDVANAEGLSSASSALSNASGVSSFLTSSNSIGTTAANRLTANTNTQRAQICVDTPQANTYANSSGLYIAGWALGYSGVKSATVLIDGQTVADSIPVTGSRPDVNHAFPGYTDGATSGFSTTINISSLSFGKHVLKVTTVLKNGSAGASVAINFVKPGSVMSLDAPAQQSTYAPGNVLVGGWALAYNGQPTVDVYLDGNRVGSTVANKSRPDVGKAYPFYANSSHSGFNYSLSILTSGHHVVRTQYTVNGVTTSSSADMNISSRQARISVDTPTSGGYANSSRLYIAGWALGDGGVKSATIRIDNQIVASNIAINGKRPDVDRAFPGYVSGAISGFAASVNISSLSYGAHTLQVSTTLNNGATGAQQTITFYKLRPQISLDVPGEGSVIKDGNVSIAGWALSYSGPASVDVYVDHQKVDRVTAKSSRPDVSKVYPQYADASKSGFVDKLSLNTSGKHLLTVQETVDGVTVSRSATVDVLAPASRVSIDTPSSGTIVSSNRLYIAGWALGNSGVKSATICIDGKTVASNILVNGSRPDVNRAFPGYTDGATSGFSTAVDLSKLSFATHTLAVSTTLNNGSAGATESITFTKPVSQISLDAPANGSSQPNGDILVGGWALSYANQPNIEIDLDGQKVAQTMADGSRPDVGKVYPQYKYSSDSGYAVALHKISVGTHTVIAHFTSDNGTVTTSKSAQFTVPGTVTIQRKLFSTTLSLLASYNGMSTDSINPSTLFGNNNSKFEFMSLYGVSGVTANEINSMLTGCGVLSGQGQAIVSAAQKYNINPVYLAAHMRIESGNGSSKLAAGISVNAGTYTDTYGRKVVVSQSGTYYNLLGIHAYDKNAVRDGSEYAASQSWNNVAAAINGGAAWISKNYIHNSQVGSGYYDQPTLYEMKWDPEGTARHHAKGSSEYATEEDWAFGISYVMSRYAYIFDQKNVTYYIPQFNN